MRSTAGPGYAALPDPPVPGAPAAQWWPPVVLGADWVREQAGTFDLVHVHFGTESRSVEELRAFTRALREAGRPLVFTAHDLEHPHLDDQAHYRAQLEVLIGAADAVLTLTGEAASAIAARHGVRAQVVPHPQLAPDAWFSRADLLRAGRARDRPVVSMHLRDLRANVRPGAWLPQLADATRQHGATLRLLVNERPGRAASAVDRLSALLGAVHDRDDVEVVVRPRPDDDGLAHELASVDVSVLPYAHGTHSGWLELCWDLGTRVLAPRVGAMADQHAEPWFLRTFAAARPTELEEGLASLLNERLAPGASERLAARRLVTRANIEAHLATYERVLAGAGHDRPRGTGD